jgi:hypothetical protein
MNIVLCCGVNGRAVVFGRVSKEPVAGAPVELTNARMVLRWPSACGGLFGLAARGPVAGVAMTAPLSRVVETVWQEWLAVPDAAAEALAAWP